MMFKASDRVTLAKLEVGEKFVCCRNGLKYKLIDKGYPRYRVKVIGHKTGIMNCFGELMKILPTINPQTLVVPANKVLP